MFFNELILFIHAITVVGLVFATFSYGKDLLVTFIALCGILANLLILKQIDLFGLHVTCTDVFMIGQLVGLNLLQEEFGAGESRRAITIAFFASIATLFLGIFHLWYTPNMFDETHGFYTTLFSPMPRIAITSIIIDFITNHLERFIYGKLATTLQKRFFVLRNILTMSLSQTFDTVAFSYLGLYGIVASVPHIIISSLFVKFFLIIAMSFLSAGSYSLIFKRDTHD
ncbi:queuosine precursor transporter [Candidatus Dependentiae bacterium]|nr:queuosine precursor transporter [Candidatus Dependentiae bacterium]